MCGIAKKKKAFSEHFSKCRPVLSAIGDNNRQLIIKVLIDHCGEGGVRVGEIQKSTNISRTAVSHHLKVLKDAKIISMRQGGTKNYYFLDPKSSSLKMVAQFWKEAEEIMMSCTIKENNENEAI